MKAQIGEVSRKETDTGKSEIGIGKWRRRKVKDQMIRQKRNTEQKSELGMRERCCVSSYPYFSTLYLPLSSHLSFYFSLSVPNHFFPALLCHLSSHSPLLFISLLIPFSCLPILFPFFCIIFSSFQSPFPLFSSFPPYSPPSLVPSHSPPLFVPSCFQASISPSFLVTFLLQQQQRRYCELNFYELLTLCGGLETLATYWGKEKALRGEYTECEH